MIKVLVCGGRDFTDFDLLEDELNKMERAYGHMIIISGMATGADTLGVKYAEKYNNPVIRFPADWDKYGRSAGPIRNQQMLDEGKPDYVLAFSGGRGTAHMIKIARKAGIEVIEIED